MTLTEAIDVYNDWRRPTARSSSQARYHCKGSLRMSVATGQAPAARIVPEVAYDAFPGHDIDEIPNLDRARTIAAASIPGAKRFRPAR